MAEANHATIQERFVGSTEELLARCAELHQADKKAEGIAGILLALGIVAIVGAVLCIWLLSITAGPVGLAVGAALGVAAAVLFFVRWRVKLGDLEDRKLSVVAEVARRLGPELKAKRPIEAEIDFRAHHKLPPKESTSSWGNGAYAYEHPWLRLSFVLQDGTKAELTGTLHAKRKTRRKRKYTKIKERCYETLTVQLAPPAGRSFAAGGLPQGLVSLGGLRLKQARITPRAARLTWATPFLTRLRARSGWSTNGELMLHPERVLGAVIMTYKAVAAAQRRAA